MRFISIRAVGWRMISDGDERFSSVNIAGVWRSFHHTLKRLLISDITIRTCEGLADVLVILYVTNVLHLSAAQYGVLVAIQMTSFVT